MNRGDLRYANKRDELVLAHQWDFSVLVHPLTKEEVGPYTFESTLLSTNVSLTYYSASKWRLLT
jgi:hypothetical protein